MENDKLKIKYQKYYNMLTKMRNDIPLAFQKKIKEQLLSSIANSLLDVSTLNILKHLKELQTLSEVDWLKKHQNIQSIHENKKKEVEKRKEEILKMSTTNKEKLKLQFEQEIKELEKTFQEELEKVDIEIVEYMDEEVKKQQATLTAAGFEGFSETDKPDEIETQMYLIDFINRISSEITDVE